jgi:hypothetical protein
LKGYAYTVYIHADELVYEKNIYPIAIYSVSDDYLLCVIFHARM